MSSWRNLMTPLYERYQSEESFTNASCSKNSKVTPLSQSMRESVSSSLHNEKLAKLQNEMSKLKSELSKYGAGSKKAENKSMISDQSNVLRLELPYEQFTPTTKRQQTHDSFTKNSYLSPDSFIKDKVPSIKGTDTKLNSSRRLVFDTSIGTPPVSQREPVKPIRINPHNEYGVHASYSMNKDELRRKEPETIDKIYERIQIGSTKSSSGKLLKTQIKPEVNSSTEDEILTTKLYRKVERRIDVAEDQETIKMSQSLRKALRKCEDELAELNQVVMTSKTSNDQKSNFIHEIEIDLLEVDLQKEKKLTQKLKNELNLVSSSNSRVQNNVMSSVTETSFDEKPKILKKSHSRPKKALTLDITESETDHKIKTYLEDLHPHKKSQSTTAKVQSKIYQADLFKNFSVKAKDSKGPIKIPSSISTKLNQKIKETGIQCDYMLEDIADPEYQQNVDNLKDEIFKLKQENMKIKIQEEKNKTIEIFQKIIKMTLNEGSHKAKRGHRRLESIRGEFTSFYDDFQNKLNKISDEKRPYGNKEVDREASRGDITAKSTASRHHQRTNSSDCMVYSPSHASTSFEFTFESKGSPNEKFFDARQFVGILDRKMDR